jgi:hypothetical protein
MENPIVLLQNQVLPEKDKYPITVKCVVDCLSDKNKDIIKIRDYAHGENINFITREYNSSKYTDDRMVITRLPAFHIYVNSCYSTTFYLNTRPYQIIEETVAAYKDKLEKKRLRKSKTWLVYLRALLKKVFHRKTAMERYQEEIEFQKERRASASRNPRDWT